MNNKSLNSVIETDDIKQNLLCQKDEHLQACLPHKTHTQWLYHNKDKLIKQGTVSLETYEKILELYMSIFKLDIEESLLIDKEIENLTNDDVEETTTWRDATVLIRIINNNKREEFGKELMAVLRKDKVNTNKIEIKK